MALTEAQIDRVSSAYWKILILPIAPQRRGDSKTIWDFYDYFSHVMEFLEPLFAEHMKMPQTDALIPSNTLLAVSTSAASGTPRAPSIEIAG
jgi:hypothetical protein